jgi:hypothetical protein
LDDNFYDPFGANLTAFLFGDNPPQAETTYDSLWEWST